jgi:adenylate kinase
MSAGQLVSDEVTNEIVDDRLSQDDAQNGVILDGYPRNQNQAEFLAQLLAKKGEKVNAVLLLDLDLFTAFKRAFGRVTAEDGGSYNIYFKNEGLDISFEEDPNGNFPPAYCCYQRWRNTQASSR